MLRLIVAVVATVVAASPARTRPTSRNSRRFDLANLEHGQLFDDSAMRAPPAAPS